MTEVKWIENFGDNLKSMLHEAWMTQQELADAAGLSRECINNYINKKRMPTVSSIINIAYALDCDVSELIDFGEQIK